VPVLLITEMFLLQLAVLPLHGLPLGCSLAHAQFWSLVSAVQCAKMKDFMSLMLRLIASVV
jgi:hypothetical protein